MKTYGELVEPQRSLGVGFTLKKRRIYRNKNISPLRILSYIYNRTGRGGVLKHTKKRSCMSSRIVFGYFLLFFCFFAPAFAAIPAGYAGKPYGGTPLSIPGKFYADRADSGAINVTYYHPGNQKYTDMLKMTGIDPYFDCTLPGYENDVVINKGDIYWAYIEPNEWMKATIDVTVAGQYQMNMLATNGDGNKQPVMMLAAVYDGIDSIKTDTLKIPYIGSCGPYDFHSWFVAKGLDTITLKAGLQVLKVQTVSNGPFNVRWTELKELSTQIQPAVQPNTNAGLHFDICAFTNGSIVVHYTAPLATPAVVSVYDFQGKLLGVKTISNVRAGTNSISIKTGFAKGVYIVRISQAGRAIESKALIR